MARATSEEPPLRYKVFTAFRPGRDLPQGSLQAGKGGLIWMMNTATLIYGQRDAVLVDTFMTVDQCNSLADSIVASGKSLKAIYFTHGHPDHFFGLKVLQNRFPNARALATSEVVAKMKIQIAPERVERQRKQFPNLPEVISVANPLEGNEIELEGNKLISVKAGHTDTVNTTFLHVPSIRLVVAGDVVYSGIHPLLSESTKQSRLEWISVLDGIEAIQPLAVVAGHKIPSNDDSPVNIAETRRYIRDFNRLNDTTSTAKELYDQMVELYPDRVNPGSLWSSATAAKAQA